MQMERLIAQMNRIEAKLDALLAVSQSGELKTESDTSTDLDEFERWWQVCPRKVAKKFARKCYWRVVNKELPHVDDPHEYLRERMAAYAQSDMATEGYAKHPSTWLNQGCWDDDDAAWSRHEQQQPERIRI